MFGLGILVDLRCFKHIRVYCSYDVAHRLTYQSPSQTKPPPQAPGTGDFGFEVDREKVGRVVVQMVWKKLHALLDSGDLHSFRFLLNLQRLYFQGFGFEFESLESLVPGFECYIDPSNDADGFIVARFLHDNRFQRLSDRDAAGWSPLCYGVLTDRVPLVKALLQARANANDCIAKNKRSANLSRKLPVLSLATVYHSNEVAQVLLARRANVNARCTLSTTALHWTAVGGNAPAVRILLEAKTNPLLRCFPDTSPFKTACVAGSTAVMREMLQLRVQGSLRFGLHMALALGVNQEGDTVSCLIEASADVNDQLHIPMAKKVWWGLLKVLHAAHYMSPSALTTLAYHHSGATPLIFATLAGKFECIPILLAAGASLDIPNSHGKTARTFLQEMHVPFSWNQTCFIPNSLPDDGSDSDDTISIWAVAPNCSQYSQYGFQSFRYKWRHGLAHLHHKFESHWRSMSSGVAAHSSSVSYGIFIRIFW